LPGPTATSGQQAGGREARKANLFISPRACCQARWAAIRAVGLPPGLSASIRAAPMTSLCCQEPNRHGQRTALTYSPPAQRRTLTPIAQRLSLTPLAQRRAAHLPWPGLTGLPVSGPPPRRTHRSFARHPDTRARWGRGRCRRARPRPEPAPRPGPCAPPPPVPPP